MSKYLSILELLINTSGHTLTGTGMKNYKSTKEDIKGFSHFKK
jgi:hypothetical protein